MGNGKGLTWATQCPSEECIRAAEATTLPRDHEKKTKHWTTGGRRIDIRGPTSTTFEEHENMFEVGDREFGTLQQKCSDFAKSSCKTQGREKTPKTKVGQSRKLRMRGKSQSQGRSAEDGQTFSKFS